MADEHSTDVKGTQAAIRVTVPAPTAWPVVLALGVTLLFAGLLTSASVSALGAVLTLAGCVGWFRDVLPHERHETVSAVAEAAAVVAARPKVVHMEVAPEIRRAYLPVEIYPISAGIKGGLAGSAAMAVLACLYGVVSHGSIWYPINLLAAVVYAQPFRLSVQQLTSFHPQLLLVAAALHVVTSLLVGLLYGVTLPMFPRRPIFLGGFLAPLIWSGLLHASLGIINPLLNQRIDWKWFVASQIGFGITAGLVVVRQERVRTRQSLPFAVLAGIEAPGILDQKKEKSEER